MTDPNQGPSARNGNDGSISVMKIDNHESRDSHEREFNLSCNPYYSYDPWSATRMEPLVHLLEP